MVLQCILFPRKTKNGKINSKEKIDKWIKRITNSKQFKIKMNDKYHIFTFNKKIKGYSYAVDSFRNGAKVIYMYNI